jgi:hypothetical protein
MSEAEAEKFHERIRQTMEETGCVFAEAVNIYIKEKELEK